MKRFFFGFAVLTAVFLMVGCGGSEGDGGESGGYGSAECSSYDSYKCINGDSYRCSYFENALSWQLLEKCTNSCDDSTGKCSSNSSGGGGYDIRTGLNCTDFLNPDCLTIPAGDAPIILEVKWDEYLPSIIRDAVQTPGRRVTAFSKYAQCRIYG